MNTNDERQNAPSASNLYRYEICPGSWRLEQAAKALKRTPDTNPYAEYGQQVHHVLAGHPEAYEKLTREQKDTVVECETITRELVLKSLDGIEGCDVLHEERLWLKSKERLFSGKADRIYIKGKHALILDFKALWGTIPDAAQNPQLRALAVLLWQHTSRSLTRIDVSIVQPARKSTVASYDVALLTQAQRLLMHTLKNLIRPQAPVIPGKHCQYCPARFVCSAPRTAILAAIKPVLVESSWPNKHGNIEVQCHPIPPDLLPKCLEAVEYMQAVAKNVRDQALQQAIREPGSVLGYETVLPRGQRRVQPENLARVAQIALEQFSITPIQFVTCCKLSLVALEKLVSDKRNASLKTAKALLNEALAHYITDEPSDPTPRLVKIKGD